MSDPDPGPGRAPSALEEGTGRPARGARRAGARRPAVVVAVVALAALVAGGVRALGPLGDGSDAKSPAAKKPASVEVSAGACGRGWSGGTAGPQVFALRNTSTTAAEVYLTDPATGAVHGEVEGLAPGTTREMRVVLGGGAYAFRCLPDDADAVTGPTVKVAGAPAGGGPAVVPITQHDLIPVALSYQGWITARSVELDDLTDELKRAVDGGDLDAARAAWLPAHLVYERMGAAYDAFGDADGAINGADPAPADAGAARGFEGFHRVEYGLWHGESAASLRGPADRLSRAVHALRASWPRERLDPAQLGLRAHEILEVTDRSELTGRGDYGSGTSLATARANLDGTRELITLLRPLLTGRYPDLPRLDAWLDRTRRTLDGFASDGTWTPLDRLGHQDRQRLNSDIGQAVELLAPVATICDPRRTA
ncbi:EfeM/EfeO family lipoprotein [Streptomyces sp. NPDC006632]|uniref:EfeM/EfeO family lipoprotein n=1 Tax=Streptomyces sp. NPDC006632 TaxID=3157182 RepID=UPI0033A16B50